MTPPKVDTSHDKACSQDIQHLFIYLFLLMTAMRKQHHSNWEYGFCAIKKEHFGSLTIHGENSLLNVY